MDIVWKKTRLGPRPSGFDGCASTAATDGKTVYVPINDGKLHAFDATTGERRWTTTYGDEDVYYTPPTIANGIVYLLGRDGRLYGFDADTGEIVLNTELVDPTGAITCVGAAGGGVTIANHTVLVSCDASSDGGGAVFALRPEAS
jgi:outer membrane protein assembly factor BamB